MANIGRPKGTPKTGGRVKGVKNKVNDKTLKKLASILYDNLPKVVKTLEEMEGKDYMWAVDKLMQRVLPPPTTDINVTGEVTTNASVQYKRDMEVLDNIPADVIADIAEKLQMSMSKVSEDTTEPDTEDYDEDGED